MSPDLLPPLDLWQLAGTAQNAGAVKALWGGGSLLTLGFLWRMLQQLYRLVRGLRYDLIHPLVHLVGFIVLLAAYRPLVATTIDIGAELGLRLGQNSSLHETFHRRSEAFLAQCKKQREAAPSGALTVDSLALSSMQGLCSLMHLAVQAAAFVVKSTQIFALATLVAAGPLVLGLASLAPALHALGLGWFWGLVEISAWAFTMDILLFVFSALGQHMPAQFHYDEELVLCCIVLFGLLSIAWVTRLVLRGAYPVAGGAVPVGGA